jgi:site-specific recombinase XerD
MELSTEIRSALPDLSDEAIAQMIVGLDAFKVEPLPTITVSQLLKGVRAEFLEIETTRIRAKVQPDGSMHDKDTSTLRHYETHWKRLEEQHGGKPIANLSKKDVKELAKQAQQSALAKHKKTNARRVSRGLPRLEYTGGTSYNSALDALSAVLTYAVENGYTAANFVPSLVRACRQESKRQALTQQELEEVIQVAASGGSDPVLDYLLLWTLSETAARRGGLINLLLGDLVREGERCYLVLYEKRSKKREQPISEELAEALSAFATERGSVKVDEPVFRYLSKSQGRGAALTARHFDTLWERVRRELPWAERKGVSAHWIRHTTLTWVERAFGPAVAKAYAGHGLVETTDHYTKVSQEEIERAHRALIGKPY